MPHVLRLALALLLLTPVAPAWAAPAVVRVFEGRAHSQPKADAPVVHTFIEGASVSVSEEVTEGWRRVRLPDGGEAWLEDASVRLVQADAAPPVAPATPAPAAPLASDRPVRDTPRARILVKDLDHLSELVKEDPVVHPMTVSMQKRSTRALVTGGTIAGVGVGTAAVVALLPCNATGVDSGCIPRRVGMGMVGVGSVLIGAFVGLAMAPDRDDLIDVLNTWNTRHPEDPFEVDLGVQASADGRRSSGRRR